MYLANKKYKMFWSEDFKKSNLPQKNLSQSKSLVLACTKENSSDLLKFGCEGHLCINQFEASTFPPPTPG